jgi:hypothetical protein
LTLSPLGRAEYAPTFLLAPEFFKPSAIPECNNHKNFYP